jgi:hypothetical protein
MTAIRTYWPLFALLAGPVLACAQVEIPSVGQPSPFYGAAGRGVKVEVTADPVELGPEDTLTYTIRVRNLDNPADVRRPDLNEFDAFRDFQVDDDPTPVTEPAGTRVFRYRLRPRKATLTAVPGFVFPYYDPNIAQPPDQPELPFRKARAEPVTIRIRKGPPGPIEVVPVDVPDFAVAPATGAGADVPRWVWWLATVLPPVLAVGTCTVWVILNPAGARLARRRRSRSARAAIRTLHSLGRHPPAEPAAVVGCVVTYLAERYDLPGLFRTPTDLAHRLREAGADPATVAECEAFLRAADAARFAPAPDVTGEALIADAEQLIRRREGEA